MFNISIKEAMKKINRFKSGIKIQVERIAMKGVCDNIVNLSESEQKLQDLQNCTRINIRISNNYIDEVKEFCYLGNKIIYNKQSKKDIKDRLMAKRNLMVSNIGLNVCKKFLKKISCGALIFME